MPERISHLLKKYQKGFHPVLDIDLAAEKLLHMDFTAANLEPGADIIDDTRKFSLWVEQKLRQAGCRFGIGGYNELRTVYDRSSVFDATKPGEEPRRLHLGTDIWGDAGTEIYAFMGGMIHSFAFNNRFGDYGPTLVTLQQLEGFPFYVLYGHLSLDDISQLSAGHYITRGQVIGHFGNASENGNWPPHLHMQIIVDMEGKEGDYPGVCRYSEREKYLRNCPDPELILQLHSLG